MTVTAVGYILLVELIGDEKDIELTQHVEGEGQQLLEASRGAAHPPLLLEGRYCDVRVILLIQDMTTHDTRHKHQHGVSVHRRSVCTDTPVVCGTFLQEQHQHMPHRQKSLILFSQQASKPGTQSVSQSEPSPLTFEATTTKTRRGCTSAVVAYL